MARRNQGGAFWALAAAGGLWAWQNRDKVRSFIEQQRQNMQGQMSGQSYSQPMNSSQPYSTPVTGATQRMDEVGTGDFTNETRTKYDPSI